MTMSTEPEDLTPGPSDTHRFFRTSPEIYDGGRLFIRSELGQPNGKADEPIVDSTRAVRDAQGLCYVALRNEECEWPEVGPVLQDLLAAEQIEEVTRADYEACRPPAPAE